MRDIRSTMSLARSLLCLGAMRLAPLLLTTMVLPMGCVDSMSVEPDGASGWDADAAVDAAVAPRWGVIRLSSSSGQLGSEGGWEWGAWVAFGARPEEDYCAPLRTFGACHRTLCAGAIYAPNPENPDFGDITVEGALRPIRLEFDTGYSSLLHANDSMPLFESESELFVSAAGGDEPPFSVVVLGSTVIEVVEPVLSRGMTVLRSEDLPFVWSPGPEGETLRVLLTADAVVDDEGGWVCEFDAAQGHGTVPTEVLSSLPSGGGQLRVSSSRSVDQLVDDWAVNVRTSSRAIDSLQRQYSNDVVFE